MDRCSSLNPFFGHSTLVKILDDGTVLAFDARVGTALLWRAGRTMRIALTTAGWRLDRIASMNDAGVIVGHATELSSGRRTAVALIPAT